MSLKDYPEAYRAYLVKVDMRVLSHFVDYILENGATSYSKLSLNIKMALKIALILCYSRPFLVDKNTRGVSIEDDLIANFLDEERVIHKNILEMHSKEIRESDKVVDDIKNLESNIVHISMHRSNSVPLEYAIVESIKEMVVKINDVADKIANNNFQNSIEIQRQPANEV